MSYRWRIILAFASIYILWGSTYLAILWVIPDIPPLLMSGLRFAAAGIPLLGWCIWEREKLPGASSLLKNSICGVLMLFAGSGSVAWSEQYVPSGLAAVIVTMVPFWFVLLDKRNWGFYFSNKIILLGLLLGFSGVFMLVFFNNPGSVHATNNGKILLGILVIVIGGMAWALGSLFSKYSPTGDSVLMNAALQLLIAGVFSVLVSLISGEARGFHFSSVSPRAWLALTYLVIAGSLITYLCYLWLLKVRPVAQVSTYVYVNPIVAVLLGAIFAGEKITPVQILALSVILCGVLLVNMAKYKTAGKLQVSG